MDQIELNVKYDKVGSKQGTGFEEATKLIIKNN